MNNIKFIRDFLIHAKNKQIGCDITGATVKIDVDKILNRNQKLSQNFKNFIIRNKNTEFTAKREINYKSFYVLEEDPTLVKWLFHVDDLILIR